MRSRVPLGSGRFSIVPLVFPAAPRTRCRCAPCLSPKTLPLRRLPLFLLEIFFHLRPRPRRHRCLLTACRHQDCRPARLRRCPSRPLLPMLGFVRGHTTNPQAAQCKWACHGGHCSEYPTYTTGKALARMFHKALLRIGTKPIFLRSSADLACTCNRPQSLCPDAGP